MKVYHGSYTEIKAVDLSQCEPYNWKTYPHFNYTDFCTIKNTAGSNNFVLSVKNWIEATNAIGITAQAGRYGGTYAHKDIGLPYGSYTHPL